MLHRACRCKYNMASLHITVLRQVADYLPDDCCLSTVCEGCSDGSVQVRSFVTGLHCQDLEGHRSEVALSDVRSRSCCSSSWPRSLWSWTYNVLGLRLCSCSNHQSPQQPRRYSPNFPLFHSLPHSPFPLPSPLPLVLPSPPLHSPPAAKRSPWNQLGDLGSTVSSPSGVLVKAPADIDFGAFWEGKTHLTGIIIRIYVYWNLLIFS